MRRFYFKNQRRDESLTPPTASKRRFLQIPTLVGILITIVGISVWIGWLLDVDILKRISPGLAAMKINTALCFLLAGSALIWRERPLIRISLSAVLCLLASTILMQYATGLDLGVDRMFFSEIHNPHEAPPERMTQAAGTSFLLSSLSLLLMGVRSRAGRWLQQGFAMCTGIIGLVALLGYAYNCHELYRVAVYSSMALHTAASIFLLSVGLVFARDDGFAHALATRGPAAQLLRRLVPVAFLIPAGFGWLMVKGLQKNLYGPQMGGAVLALTMIFSLVALVWWTAQALNRADVERRRTEEALAKAKADLEQQNQELEQRVNERTAKLQSALGELEHFSYTITHDLRAPLRAMRGYGDILLQSGEFDSTSVGYIQRINSAAERMDRLILDALDYGKLVRQDFALKRVEPEILLRGIIDSYPGLQEPQARVQIQGHMPAILGNEACLIQCFSNLLNNAVKFVDSGVTPLVRIWAEERNGDHTLGKPADSFVKIWFEDNGIGIPEDCRERIFTMFQRLSTEHEGTGIGLALVRKAAERMGGKVGVESQIGKGSRFWLELKKDNTRL